jgi:hypothetical protein
MRQLVDNKTGEPIKIGDPVETFRGERGTLIGVTITGHGKVAVQFQNEGVSRIYFPSVINAHFTEEAEEIH